MYCVQLGSLVQAVKIWNFYLNPGMKCEMQIYLNTQKQFWMICTKTKYNKFKRHKHQCVGSLLSNSMKNPYPADFKIIKL